MNDQPQASTAAVKQQVARNFDQVAGQYDGTEEIFAAPVAAPDPAG